MRWKLRIPFLLLMIGIVSGIHQKIPAKYLIDLGYVTRSAVFLIVISLLFTLFERLGINDRRIHFSVEILLILIGYLFDNLEVKLMGNMSTIEIRKQPSFSSYQRIFEPYKEQQKNSETNVVLNLLT